jgi:hypothetical protein
MRVRYIGEDRENLKQGEIYEVISLEKGWFRIRTEAEEGELVPPEQTETVARDWNFDADEIFH